MICILNHVGDAVRGAVEVYLDVGARDLTLNPDQQAFLKAATTAKRKIGVVSRQFGGTTLFSYSAALTPQDEFHLIAMLTGSLGTASPVVNVESSRSWEGI